MKDALVEGVGRGQDSLQNEATLAHDSLPQGQDAGGGGERGAINIISHAHIKYGHVQCYVCTQMYTCILNKHTQTHIQCMVVECICTVAHKYMQWM